jgi:hypothetical protein
MQEIILTLSIMYCIHGWPELKRARAKTLLRHAESGVTQYDYV